jgi:phosphate transport system protein
MSDPLRSNFRRRLDQIDLEVRGLFGQVAESLPRATRAVITGDASQTALLARAVDIADDVQARVEAELQVELARQSPVGSDLRFLLTVSRVVPELERSAELVSHIADRAGVAAYLSVPIAGAFASMGETAAQMWEGAAAAWVETDPDAADRLDRADNQLDRAVTELVDLLATSGLTASIAMECRLVGRFYERLGDHAVHLSERIRWRAMGASPIR